MFGSRTTATLGEWSEHQVTLAAVITQVKRQISKKTGKEYARLILEDFHGTAEAIVFPDAWAKLNQVVKEDLAVLLTGGYSARDRGEERAPFVIESGAAAGGADGLRRAGPGAPLEAARGAGAGGAAAGGGAVQPASRARRRSILNGATATGSGSGPGPAGSGSRQMRNW